MNLYVVQNPNFRAYGFVKAVVCAESEEDSIKVAREDCSYADFEGLTSTLIGTAVPFSDRGSIVEDIVGD